MKPNNPFPIAGYISPDYFCDRKKETEQLIDALQNERNITLIAPRRMGKTGLIKNVFYHLQEKKVVTFYMDIYSTQCLSDFVHLFAITVLGQLDSTPPKTIKRVAQFVKSCRPSITFDEVSGNPQISLNIEPHKEETSLKEIFDYLASSEKQCIIAIDEFQQIASYSEKGVEALLRSFIQFTPNVKFIFSGSKQHVMQEMFLSAKRPFYQSTQVITIGTIPMNTYYTFASSFFAQQACNLPEVLFNSLYNRFDGHTWYLQVLLNRLYGYRQDIDENLADKVLLEIIAENEYTYQSLLAAFPQVTVKLLKAIGKEGVVTAPNSGKFITKYNLKAASSVNRALNQLMEHELIYKTDKGFIVYDRFMGIWLNKQNY